MAYDPNNDVMNIGQVSVLYGAKVVDYRQAVRLVSAGSPEGKHMTSLFRERFPWELAVVLCILGALLGLLFADAIYHVTAMTRGTRLVGSMMIGAMFGTILVPFIVDLVRYVKARGRQ